jgi:hypothetical protein
MSQIEYRNIPRTPLLEEPLGRIEQYMLPQILVLRSDLVGRRLYASTTLSASATPSLVRKPWLDEESSRPWYQFVLNVGGRNAERASREPR